MNVTLDIGECVAEAWRGFKGWWIPLCIIAAIILFSQSWLPHWLLSDSFTKLVPYQIVMETKQAVMSGDMTLLEASNEINTAIADLVNDPEQLQALGKEIKNLAIRICIVAGVLLIPIAFMLLLMIIFSKASVQTRKEDITLKRDLSRSTLMSFSYIFLALLKMIAFSLWVIPTSILGFGKPGSLPVIILLVIMIFVLLIISVFLGPWVYVKLFFTGFIITEESVNPLSAIAKSWKMTRGNFFRVFCIFIIMIGIDIVTLPTVIGVIPGNSFCYTLRAAAYKKLKPALQ